MRFTWRSRRSNIVRGLQEAAHREACQPEAQVWIASDVLAAEKRARNRRRVKKTRRMISGRNVFVVNGDIFLDVDCAFHEGRKALATLTVALAEALAEDGGRFDALCLIRKWRHFWKRTRIVLPVKSKN